MHTLVAALAINLEQCKIIKSKEKKLQSRRLSNACIILVYPILFIALFVYNYFNQYYLVLNGNFFGDGVCYNDINMHLIRHITAILSFCIAYVCIFLLVRNRFSVSVAVSALVAFACSIVLSGQIISNFVCPE
ncbi:membrane protein of unknown function [Rhizobium leguminosarum]|uniref:Uncharacterized protein n=1 Tax=Rhizobium leguminosarum TaxID=384 RepID=A0A2K9YYK6_RHILE|nr:membrane protein of unknown function [Rhizobium leguminosarum]